MQEATYPKLSDFILFLQTRKTKHTRTYIPKQLKNVQTYSIMSTQLHAHSQSYVKAWHRKQVLCWCGAYVIIDGIVSSLDKPGTDASALAEQVHIVPPSDSLPIAAPLIEGC